ncbi:hypothetical protein AK812_SmicGene736 [Symbiodinium microadriaticum]|uniref:Uncharacterized protein n=1 Tax=Symbiodinium microadriaticum TaxID=2951 RepID=A0A1Q9F5V4_SYMMI|nr:hypothetical protein AK812_SmicGene736 [Symbiodinium microadriaticum]
MALFLGKSPNFGRLTERCGMRAGREEMRRAEAQQRELQKELDEERLRLEGDKRKSCWQTEKRPSGDAAVRTAEMLRREKQEKRRHEEAYEEARNAQRDAEEQCRALKERYNISDISLHHEQQADLAQCRSELDAATEELERSKAEGESLEARQRLSTQQQEVHGLQSALQMLAAWEPRREGGRTKVTSLQASLDELSREKADLEAQVRDFQAKLALQSSCLSARQEELRQLQESEETWLQERASRAPGLKKELTRQSAELEALGGLQQRLDTEPNFCFRKHEAARQGWKYFAQGDPSRAAEGGARSARDLASERKALQEEKRLARQKVEEEMSNSSGYLHGWARRDLASAKKQLLEEKRLVQQKMEEAQMHRIQEKQLSRQALEEERRKHRLQQVDVASVRLWNADAPLGPEERDAFKSQLEEKTSLFRSAEEER